jgi:hypothetical protein
MGHVMIARRTAGATARHASALRKRLADSSAPLPDSAWIDWGVANQPLTRPSRVHRSWQMNPRSTGGFPHLRAPPPSKGIPRIGTVMVGFSADAGECPLMQERQLHVPPRRLTAYRQPDWPDRRIQTTNLCRRCSAEHAHSKPCVERSTAIRGNPLSPGNTPDSPATVPPAAMKALVESPAGQDGP